MKLTKKLFGVVSAMTTPFDESGKVKLDSIEEHAEFLINKGVHGLYPLGTTGEMLRIDKEERKSVAKKVVEVANNRVNVFIHVGAMLEDDTIELAKHAHKIGADGIGVVTPAYFNAKDKEIEEYFVREANSVPKDYSEYLYNIPQCASNLLSLEVSKNIAKQSENLIGV